MQARVRAILRRAQVGVYVYLDCPALDDRFLNGLIEGAGGGPRLFVHCHAERRLYRVPVETLPGRDLPPDLLQALANHDPSRSAVIAFDGAQRMGNSPHVHFATLLVLGPSGLRQTPLAVFPK